MAPDHQVGPLLAAGGQGGQRRKNGVVTKGTNVLSFVVRGSEELAPEDKGKGIGVVGGLTLGDMHSGADLFMLVRPGDHCDPARGSCWLTSAPAPRNLAS